MTPRLDMIGIHVRDMAASLAFYRRLGLDIPDGSESEGHVEATLPGGLRVGWDTYAVMRSFDPGWEPPGEGPHGSRSHSSSTRRRRWTSSTRS